MPKVLGHSLFVIFFFFLSLPVFHSLCSSVSNGQLQGVSVCSSEMKHQRDKADNISWWIMIYTEQAIKHKS